MGNQDIVKCSICQKETCTKESKPLLRSDLCKCTNCGEYLLDEIVYISHIKEIKSDYERSLISYAIRKRKGSKDLFILDFDFIDHLIKDRKLPDHREQINNSILLIGELSEESFGKNVNISSKEHQAIIGTENIKTMLEVILYLLENEYIKGFKPGHQSGEFDENYSLTYSGWDKYYEIKRGKINSKSVFMAMPFNKPELDNLFDEYYKPAVKQTGFHLVRVDEQPKAGSIDNRIRVDIRMSKFLIAEITGGNRGAYWEAGFAEGLGKQVIYSCDVNEKDNTHFDTRNLHTIFWDKNKMEEAAEDLKATIRATFPDEAKMRDE